MSTMWPHDIPPEIEADPFRSAEVRVFRKLQAELPDAFVVFYAKPWFGFDPHGNEVDGECDFLVAHPDMGFLAIEVKGGGISYDPRTDSWTSVNRHGDRFDIKNPLRQAMISKKQVIRKLKEKDRNPPRYTARHGVIFPDCAVDQGDLSAEAPRQLICDCDEFDTGLEAWIRRRFTSKQEAVYRETPLGSAGIKRLHDIFAKPISLSIPLRKTLTEDEKSLDVLTQEQFRLLKFIEHIPRVTIPGGAGTGKTVLAVQELLNCAEKGMRSLYTCYNDGLVTQIRERTQNIDLHGNEILNFHELCIQFCREAKLPVPKEPSEKSAKKEYFETTLPNLLGEAVEKTDKRYDAIIVDEGQDIRSDWWPPLLKTLSSDPNSRLRIFYDDNQRLYDSENMLPLNSGVLPVNLTRNLRNTRNIFELISKHYKGPDMESTAPEGLEVNWVETDSERAISEAVLQDLTVLLFEENIPPDRITVLAQTQDEVKRLRSVCRSVGIASRACDEKTPDTSKAIIIDTIRRFKGLECFCLILALTESAVQDRELIYVAISRPKTFLSIVGTKETLERVQEGVGGL